MLPVLILGIRAGSELAGLGVLVGALAPILGTETRGEVTGDQSASSPADFSSRGFLERLGTPEGGGISEVSGKALACLFLRRACLFTSERRSALSVALHILSIHSPQMAQGEARDQVCPTDRRQLRHAVWKSHEDMGWP